MKSNLFNLFLIFLLLNISYVEGGFFDDLIKGLTNPNGVNNTEENESKEEEDIIDENIYEMNSTKDFDLNIKVNGTKDNVLIILFYSPDCIHCRHFLPVYRNISETLKNDTSLKFSKIKYSKCKEIFNKYTQIKVMGIPTVYIYQKGRFTRQEGKRTQENVISFIYQIKNFDCNEITSLEELSTFINKNTIFSLDEEKQFILGIFKKNENFNKNFIEDNFVDLISLIPDIVLSKKCYYFFKDENTTLNLIDKNNFYLKHALNEKRNEIGDYLIYSYNYQKGMNSFPLFNSYLHLQNNLTKINDMGNININKIIKTIRYKFKVFVEENYYYKYHYIYNSLEVSGFRRYDKKMFIFYYDTPELEKFYINEINYILSLNHSLVCDYLFILYNSINEIDTENKRLSFFDMEDFESTVLLTKNELNKESIESKIFEYISKDRKHQLKTKIDTVRDLFKGFFNWIDKYSNNTQKSKSDSNDSNKDYEQELIDEINKTIIEDEIAQKIEEEKQRNQSNVNEKKKSKNLNNNNQRRIIIESNIENELGFNKNFVVFPLFLIIYSLLYFVCYKYIFGKNRIKIFYQRLPTEDPKSK